MTSGYNDMITNLRCHDVSVTYTLLVIYPSQLGKVT